MATNWDRLHIRIWHTSSRMLGQVPVVYGAISTYGMFDRKSELVLDDQIVSVENALTIKTSELGGLRYGDHLSVDGETYRVRSEPMRMADGMLSVVSLEKVADESVTVVLNGDFL